MFYTTPYRTAPGGCCAPFVPLAGKTNNQERNKNMKTNRKAAVLALGLALLAPLAGAQEVVDSEWWNVNFDGSFQEGFEGLTIGELGALTNNESKGNVVQPYASGVWEALDGDESYVTNECYPSASGGTNWCIKLDTQGNDLTWTPTNEVNGVTNIYQKIALVDADLYLVGSDSAPDPADFDANADVQSAIFLKNETDEDSGETTNSILCVYVTVGKNTVWQELEGPNGILDNTWHRVTVLMDHESHPDTPMVEVYVDGILLHARGNPSMTSFMAANSVNASKVGCIQSVSFRGTGAIDNFVGKTRKETFLKAYFKAVAYLDTERFPAMDQTTDDLFDIGGVLTPEFTDFYFDDYPTKSYALSRVEIEDFATPTTMAFHYGYDKNDSMFPLKILDDESTNYVHVSMVGEGDGAYQQGDFSVEVPSTAGATQPENYEDPATAIPIVRIYYKTVGAFYANKVTEINGTVATNGTLLKPVAAGGTYPTNLVWTFPATDGANVLTGVKVENGATATYDSATRVATATVTLATALETNKTFVTATYAEGSYEGKTPTWIDNEDGTYVLGNYVAKIDGDPKPVYFGTLQDAFDAVPTDGTETKVKLLADIATKSVVAEGQNVFLDLGGFSITTTNDDGIENKGTLALTNGTITARWSAVYNTGDGASLVVWDGTYESTGDVAFSIHQAASNVSITVHGGTITSQEACIAIYGGGSLPVADRSSGNRITVTGGTLTSRDNAVIMTNGTEGQGDNVVTVTGGRLVGGIQSAGNIACGIYLANNDTLTFGGDAEIVVTGGAGIVARAGAARIGVEGGTITTTGTTTGKVGDAATALPCAAIVYDTSAGYPGLGENASLTVTGGTFVSDVDPIVQIKREGDATILAVSGGSFSDVVPAEYCAPGFVPVTTQDENGRYTVKLGAIQVGTDTYGAFADAIPVHGWGATYTLLTNVEETVTITNAAEKLFVEVGDDADRTNGLEVVTTVEGDAQYAYTVKATLENGVTTYSVVQTTKTYEIVFNVDQVAVLTTNAPYGDTLYGPVTDPTKDSSETTDFAFAGWTNVLAGGAAVATADLPAVTTNATWDAVFTESVRKYTITWTMDDDSVIDTTTVAYGATPTHADPTKDPTAEFSYEFAGWSPEVVEVTGEATYKATFTATTRSYAVTFLDGTEEEGDDPFYATNVLYGATLYGPAADPTKASTAEKDFTFAGWTNAAIDAAVVATADLPAVAGEATYTAVFTESARTYEIVFNDADGTPLATTNAPYGDTLYGPADPTKAADAQFTYAFAGWTNAAIDAAVVSAANLPAVDAAATYTAVYTATVNEYTITFSTNGVAYVTTDVAYGATEYGPADPARDGFTFDGWTNSVSGAFVAQGTTVFPAVNGTAEWTAVWTEDLVVQAIDPGNAMSAEEKAANPPVAVTSAGFTVHFKGVKGVTYSLLAAGSLDVTQSDWENPDADANSKVTVVQSVSITTDAQASEVQTLTATMTDSVKFFKIGARKTGN